mmetsp:Transcript_22146/g.50731  ORF Transcript_22146/g.50731 Transcript_22146/m.50731 type:complete len:82 (-) Transcript_22146:233-478(-)
MAVRNLAKAKDCLILYVASEACSKDGGKTDVGDEKEMKKEMKREVRIWSPPSLSRRLPGRVVPEEKGGDARRGGGDETMKE